MDSALFFDGLWVSSLGGSAVLLAVGFAVHRLRTWSHHVLCQMVLSALLCSLGIFLVTLLVKPGAVGCLAVDCRPEVVEPLGQSQRHFTFAALGKFGDITMGDREDTLASPAPAWMIGFLFIWISGFSVLLARLSLRQVRTAQLIRQAEPILSGPLMEALRRVADRQNIRTIPRLVHHDDVDVPVTGGTFRPVIFLSKSLERKAPEQIEMILLHELAHVLRRDPLATLVAELTTACFWFNPFIWKAADQLRQQQELAADSEVLIAGVRPSRYAQCLIETFRDYADLGPTPMPAAHSILGGRLFERRLRTVLDPDRRHQIPRRSLTVATVAVFSTLSVGAAMAPEALSSGEGVPRLELNHSVLNPTALDKVLRPLFIDTMAERRIAGAAIAIVHEGKLVYDRGFGSREVYQEKPVDSRSTIFRVGSISKVLTGVAVMQLVDRGLLDLDSDVNDYLTEFKVPENIEEPVRVRHLLTHTAGFDQIGLGRHVGKLEDVLPLGEFLKDNLIRVRPPGEVSCYDTYAITLAGYLVERLSGMPFERYLRQEIFEPLEMHRSGIAVPPALVGDTAVGYEFDGKWIPMRWEFMNTAPASTINSTVVDMANFAIMLLQEGRFRDQQILSSESAEAMLTQQYTNHPDHPGYGFTFIEDSSHGVGAFGHGGSMTGFGAYLHLVPEFDLGIYISYNQESGTLSNAAVSRLIAELFSGRRPGREMRQRYEEQSDLSRFAGTYANNMYHHTDPTTGWSRRPLAIETSGRGLKFRDKWAYQVGPLDFQRDDGVLLSFRENSRGEITYLLINQAAYERLGP
ncbi:MAG: serine hydrolase [Deltaproteobacteria bacterium]|nr:serine hydrolase [Deltaproteobacteria bacterium]